MRKSKKEVRARVRHGQAQPGLGDARLLSSRLVITGRKNPIGETHERVESNSVRENPRRDESSIVQWVDDYESETERIRVLGNGYVLSQAVPIPLDSAAPDVALIDWCAFTVRAPAGETHVWVMRELQRLAGFGRYVPRKTGLFGYKESAEIEEAGLIAWGGAKQRDTVYVSLNGQGCSRIDSWQKLHDWCVLYKVKLTRVDYAHDDFSGTEFPLEKVRDLWTAGGFNSGGRKPKASLAGDWWGGEKGRTVYIGSRESGKLLRVYEKGKQLGDLQSPWVRVELELHSKDRHIPIDSLIRPGAYLAGSYRCLRILSATQSKVKTTGRGGKTSLDKVVKSARNQYGKAVNLLLKVKLGDYAAVVGDLIRDGLPKRLASYSYHVREDAAFIEALGGATPI